MITVGSKIKERLTNGYFKNCFVPLRSVLRSVPARPDTVPFNRSPKTVHTYSFVALRQFFVTYRTSPTETVDTKFTQSIFSPVIKLGQALEEDFGLTASETKKLDIVFVVARRDSASFVARDR